MGLNEITDDAEKTLNDIYRLVGVAIVYKLSDDILQPLRRAAKELSNAVEQLKQ